VARRFAAANFIAYAPDGLTSVGGFPGNDEQGAVKFREVNGPKMMEDFVASANWLRTNPECTGKLGAIGFCFGGGIVNQLAVRLGKDLGAGAPFYGRQAGADDVPKIMAPIQAHYADPKIDTGVGNGIAAFEAAMKANNKTLEVFIYDAAQHGFHNDTTPRYDEKSAKLATQRYMDFFNKNLR
jgi:carboxymethylenebutenolidase